MGLKERHGWSSLGIPGSVPCVAWVDSLCSHCTGQRWSLSGIPASVLGNPGGSLRSGHVGSLSDGRGWPLIRGGGGPLRNGRFGPLMGGRVWATYRLSWWVNLGGDGTFTWEAQNCHFMLAAASCVGSDGQFRMLIYGGSGDPH